MTEDRITALTNFAVGNTGFLIENGAVRPIAVVWNTVLKDTILFTVRFTDTTENIVRIVKMQDINTKLFRTEEEIVTIE